MSQAKCWLCAATVALGLLSGCANPYVDPTRSHAVTEVKQLAELTEQNKILRQQLNELKGQNELLQRQVAALEKIADAMSQIAKKK